MTPNIGHLVRALLDVPWADLKRALDVQRERPNERLGAILVELGALSRPELERVLERQNRLRCGEQLTQAELIALADYTADLLSGAAK